MVKIDLNVSVLISFFLQFKNYTHDVGKAVRRVPKRNRRALECKGKRRSALNVRLFLREFCVDFLENCYNHLMYLVKVCGCHNGKHLTIAPHNQIHSI